MRRVTSSWALIVCSLVIASAGFAQQASITAVPNLIRFGGTLKDAQGAPLASPTVGLTFAIYKQQDGGAAVWMETQSVATDGGGNYSALLGSTTAAGLPGDLFSQQEQRWLGVQVQGQAEEPRVLLVSVPYAFKAHEAETLGGKSVSDFVLVNGASSSANGTSTTQTGPNTANSLPASGGARKGAASAGPTNFSGSTTDQIVGVTQTGTGAGVIASAPTKGVGTATATTGTAIGVEGGSAGSGGYGVYGNVTSATGATVGVKGNSQSSSGTGVRGTNIATSGATTGVSGYVDSAAGTAEGRSNQPRSGGMTLGVGVSPRSKVEQNPSRRAANWVAAQSLQACVPAVPFSSRARFGWRHRACFDFFSKRESVTRTTATARPPASTGGHSGCAS